MSFATLINKAYPAAKVHHVLCQEPYVTFIREGRKTVEGRIGTPYYTKICAGDIIHLYNRTTEIWCRVMRTAMYPSFRQLLEKEGLKNMLPQASSIEEGVYICKSFSAGREPRFGAFAIGVKPITTEDLKEQAPQPIPERKAGDTPQLKRSRAPEQPDSDLVEKRTRQDSEEKQDSSHFHRNHHDHDYRDYDHHDHSHDRDHRSTFLS